MTEACNMRAIRDKAKMSPIDRLVLAGGLFFTAAVCLFYAIDVGFSSPLEAVLCIVVLLAVTLIRFCSQNRPEETDLHIVQVNDKGVTAWDNRGRMVKIYWDEMSLVVVHNIIAGRELTVNGGEKRLRITDVFCRFDQIVRAVCKACREKGIRCLR